MKKKGLIIATIVMVLVLAVSLTTATYAWFNASAAATVQDVTVSVASATNISIGIAKDSTSDRSNATTYVNGTVIYTETSTAADKGKGLGTFASEEDQGGLGTKVNWDWTLSSIGGVSSSANGTSFDASYTKTNALYNGSYTSESPTTPVLGTVATYNVATNLQATPDPIVCSVIYAPFGLRVEKPNLNYLYCDIDITADDANFWGIVAALKLEISGPTSSYEGHPFHASSGDGLMSTLNTYQSKPTTTTKKVTFRFIIAKDTTDPLANGPESSIYQFNIRMFIDGEDASCIADATQYNAKIGLKFDALSSTDYAALGTTNAATATTDLSV